MGKHLNKNFTKIEIIYPRDTTLTPISFYFDQSKDETIMLNPGVGFFTNLQKEDPPTTRFRVTNKKLKLCLTSNDGFELDEGWNWYFEPYNELGTNYCFDVEKDDNPCQLPIYIWEFVPWRGIPDAFTGSHVTLQTMFDFFINLPCHENIPFDYS